MSLYWNKANEIKPKLNKEIMAIVEGNNVIEAIYKQAPHGRHAFFDAKNNEPLVDVINWKYKEDFSAPAFLRLRSGCRDGNK